MDIKIKNLFSEGHTKAWAWFEKHTYPWEMLSEIGSIILEIGKTLDLKEYRKIGDNIWVANNVVIPPTASITGPAIIDKGTEIRPGAFIRGSVLAGENCVIGNSCELKNCILFDNVQVPHFNYVGDSILGNFSHMGAGSVTSNQKSDKSKVAINNEGNKIETGLDKMGAILADHVEVGCNSVLNPGTIIGKESRIYPTSSVRGVVPERSLYKSGTDFKIVPLK